MGSWCLSLLGFGGLGQRKCASQQRPSPALARSHHDGITRQNAARTPTVTWRLIKMHGHLDKRGVRLIAVWYQPGAADRQTGKQSLNVEMTGPQQLAAKPLPAVVVPCRLACYDAC